MIATHIRAALSCLLALLLSDPAEAQPSDAILRIHAPPAGKAFWSHLNDDFTVRVRVPGGAWRDLYEYDVKVDLDRPQHASMVTFGMAGPVEVAVKKNNGDVRRVQVRPASAGLRAKLIGDTAYFRLDRPASVSVEFDGDRLHNLHLFATPPEPPLPSPGPGVVYFGPGVHPLPEGQKSFRIPSNTKVVIAGGALVQGNIEIRDAENVDIVGHGVVDRPVQGITIANSRNVTVDGPIVLNPTYYSILCGQSAGIAIRNVKSFSASSWSDGLDFLGCSDVSVDGVFMRNSDDTIAIYGGRGEFKGDARNYRITNAILWADVAHAINIGIHGTGDQAETLENIEFRNIDILGHDEDDREYQGAMAITDGDNNLVRNVRFEDIRVDEIEEGNLFNFRVVFNAKYSHAPGRGIEDITLRNIRFKGGDINRPVIAGHSEHRRVRGVRIENVTIGGKRLKRADIEIGPFVDDLVVR